MGMCSKSMIILSQRPATVGERKLMRTQKREKEGFIMSALPEGEAIGSRHPESPTCELKHNRKNFPLNDSLTIH